MDTLFSTDELIEQEFKEINRLTDRGQIKKALKLCEALFESNSNHPRVLHGVGMLRYRTGVGRKDVEQLLRTAIHLKPDFADAYHSLGIMFHNAVLQDEAEEHFRKALVQDPIHYKAMASLATVLITKGKIKEAHELCDKALVLSPLYSPIYHNIGNIMQAYGRTIEAITFLKKSIKISKMDSAYSCLLFAMNLVPIFTQSDVYEESVRWGQIYSRPRKSKSFGHLNSHQPDRRLRIGYVSGDFKLHPVTFHLKPVLANHNKNKIEVFLYNSFPHTDLLTEELAGYADIYRDISSLSDDRVEELIRKDGIDILVDLAGHTAFNRLGLFIRKPAPVQVTWLGYFNTTGLTSIDYLISDPITIPQHEECYFTEQILRLPDCRFCYQPLPNAPEVTESPVLRNGYLTFGSFNAIQKITDEVLALWSCVLLQVPNSKIVLKSKMFSDEHIKEDFLRKFATFKVAPERVDLRPGSSYGGMLLEYGDIDIALDTFPYNGGATTCEALWMGVPVVTLEGGTPISRQSKAFLYTIGYPGWVAKTNTEFIDIILCLTSNFSALQEIRIGLRHKMQDSPLCNGKVFTGHLEAAYQQIWKRWCSETAPVELFRSFNADELCNAGYNYLEDKYFQQAFEMFNRTLCRKPRHIEALNGLGKTLGPMGNPTLAEKTFRKAIRRDPKYFYSYFNLGFHLLNSGKFHESRRELKRALQLDPDHVETLINLGVTNRLLGRLQEAQQCCEKALEVSPDHTGAMAHLAYVSGDQGDIPRAVSLLKKALLLEKIKTGLQSDLISYMFYEMKTQQKDLFELSKQIGNGMAKNSLNPLLVPISFEHRSHLRIGFVSPDFGNHPVGMLLMALFNNRNSERLSLYCYSNRSRLDTLSEWYQNSATVWRDISNSTDVEAANLIMNDKIDILIDLSGHTIMNRINLFTLQPSVVQASWIGYGHTTGLINIDFIVGDEYFIRPQDEQWFSEQVIRLPTNRFCFTPPSPCPEVVEPPFYDNDYITFGSFNNPMKISEQVIALWSQILLRVPNSHLILKYKAFGDRAVRRRYQDLFAKHGISRKRIEFRRPSNQFFMMMEYGDIDIALDPFPFTGGMTSLFSLWMGVPIVTLSGELPISRQTESFLKLVGLQDLIAFNEEEYIFHAVALAGNHEKLSEIRGSLRDTMASSLLCDGKRHAADVEHAFFEMWQKKVNSIQDNHGVFI